MKRNIWIVIAGVFFTSSIVFGFLYFSQHNKATQQDNYPLLAKRIFADNPNDVIINFNPLRKEVQQYLDSTNIPHSFYFEYLPTGSNIRDGDANELIGASLMKIPLVMDLYKANELGKINLDQEYTVQDQNMSTDAEYGNTSHLKVGDKITLREAAKRTLAESDNTSAEVISAAIKDKIPESDQTINNLDVETTTKNGVTGKFVLIGSRSYTSFLKCLYFSCAVSKEHSQEILNYLAQSSEKDRLRSGVPKETPFAHKIGSFSKFTQSDCGIVYQPNRQYSICLMLQAPENQQTSDQFKKVSEMVYDYVKNAN